MFTFRYHVVSLAAVFVALVVGILVGIGISGRGFVDKSERRQLQNQIDDLRNQRDDLSAQLASSQKRQKAAQEYVSNTYRAVMSERLRGKRIAVLFVGHVDPDLRANVDDTLTAADAPAALRVRALKTPVDPAALDAVLTRRPALAQYAGDANLKDLGRALGEQFVAGGDTPLWTALSDLLVEERTGSPLRPADGVVVVRSAGPQEGPTARLLAGFYAGLAAGGVPVVGVETTKTTPSAVPTYAHAGLSSVDDVDILEGRLALSLLLAGADPGHYGLKQTADTGYLPPVEPLPVATTGG
ncbi:MAG: copper transporter [Thermoleophilia bacterium]